MNIDFIKDPQTLSIIDAILNLVGPNFSIPHDSDVQPSSGVERNNEELTQYDIPGGTTLKSMMPPSANPGMGSVISSLLTVLAPIISAYGLLLPIIGIIKAIIEIICCLMNPFCIVPAVIRLFKKYLPPFISLFPPAAGIIIMKSTIKLIMSIVFFIMTEIVPAIQLIITLVECVITAFEENNTEKAEACKKKILAVITQLLNKIGILSVMEPLLEIIMLILQLISGIPCSSGKASSKTMAMLFPMPSFDLSKSDTECCNNEQCPVEISNPPNGTGLLIRTFYGDSPPGWAWQLLPLTGHQNIPKLIPYLQDLKSQLDPQLDEPVSIAVPAGSKRDAAHFRLRILGRRGEKFCVTQSGDTEPVGSVTVPIANIVGTRIIMNNVILFQWEGVVEYCIEPNFEQLIGRNILSVGCHPDVIKAKADVERQFASIMEQPAMARIPELANLNLEVSGLYNDLKNDINKIPTDDFSLDDIPKLEEIQETMLKRLTDFANKLKGYLNIIVSRIVDKVITTFEVDKNIVKAGGVDFSLVMVTPRDVTGTALMSNMPSDTDLSVELFTDFGILQNQRLDSNTGTTTAELISPFPGRANVTAKVSGDFVMTSYEEDAIIKIEHIQFIADAILPKRRQISRSQSKTGAVSEREPGNR